LQLISIGEVPTDQRKVKIKANGTTILSSYWPVDLEMSKTSIKDSEGWKLGATTSLSDKVVLAKNGSTSTLFHNGSNWRRVGLGSPISDNNILPSAGAAMINKIGGEAGYKTLADFPPYNL
jgi:hypothetical protein